MQIFRRNKYIKGLKSKLTTMSVNRSFIIFFKEEKLISDIEIDFKGLWAKTNLIGFSETNFIHSSYSENKDVTGPIGLMSLIEIGYRFDLFYYPEESPKVKCVEFLIASHQFDDELMLRNSFYYGSVSLKKVLQALKQYLPYYLMTIYLINSDTCCPTVDELLEKYEKGEIGKNKEENCFTILDSSDFPASFL